MVLLLLLQLLLPLFELVTEEAEAEAELAVMTGIPGGGEETGGTEREAGAEEEGDAAVCAEVLPLVCEVPPDEEAMRTRGDVGDRWVM